MSRRLGRLVVLGVTVGLGTAFLSAGPASAAPVSPAVHASPPARAAQHTTARRSPAHPAAALPYAVNLGYVDNVRANPVNFPTPWEGSPNVVYEGCSGSCTFDGGAVQVVNTSTHVVTVASLVIHYDTCTYDIWPHGVAIPKGGSMIVTQTTSGATSGCTPSSARWTAPTSVPAA